MLNEVVYVAAISDDILLGVDLLRKHHAEINILKFTLSLQGQNISMTSEGETDISYLWLLCKKQSTFLQDPS